MKAQDIISQFGLEAHVEGGYFKRCYESDHRPAVATKFGERLSMTAIYYMLTRENAVGFFHKNRSDIMHVHCSGAPLRYYLLDEKNQFSSFVLGPDITKGHHMQRVVNGGTWKATELVTDCASYGANHHEFSHDYGLLTEVVVPGFSYEDMTLASGAELAAICPEQAELIARLVKPKA